MKKCLFAAALMTAAIGFFLFTQPAAAQSTPVYVFIANGVKAPIDELIPQAERAIGHPLEIQFGTTASLKQRIEAGEAFDAAILTFEAIEDLVKKGKLVGDTRADLARGGIGVGMRAGAAKPDIRTADALKRVLQNAKAITFAQEGASRPYIEKMFDHFGIAAEIKAKTVLTPNSAKSSELVRDGKADFILTLVSEILAAPGMQLVGPLPAEVQGYISFAGSVSAKAANAPAGKALIQFFKGPAAGPVYKAKGMEPR
jgi:molybdate transport system substrate-binding protein